MSHKVCLEAVDQGALSEVVYSFFFKLGFKCFCKPVQGTSLTD